MPSYLQRRWVMPDLLHFADGNVESTLQSWAQSMMESGIKNSPILRVVSPGEPHMLSFTKSRPQGQMPLGLESNSYCFTFFSEWKPLIQIVVTVGTQPPFLFHIAFPSPQLVEPGYLELGLRETQSISLCGLAGMSRSDLLLPAHCHLMGWEAEKGWRNKHRERRYSLEKIFMVFQFWDQVLSWWWVTYIPACFTPGSWLQTIKSNGG